MAKILIVDDERSVRELLYQYTKSQGHDSVTADSGKTALHIFDEHQPDLMIVDLRIGDMSGLEIIQETKKRKPNLAVIMATGHGTVETAVEAMRLGAFDYLTKPFQLEELGAAISSALNAKKSTTGINPASATISTHEVHIVAESEVMKRIQRLVDRLAQRPTPLLLEGESGVGKRTLARVLHTHRGKEASPFKVLACGALPEALIEQELTGGGGSRGILERAAGGTLVLDEVDTLSSRLQSLLQNTLESNRSGTAGIQLISTASRKLESLVKDGKFRPDLFFKLAVIPLAVPPLRERKEDILPLAEHFLAELSSVIKDGPKKIATSAKKLLEKYPWPGNVGELKNAVERSFALAGSDAITEKELPPKLRDGTASVALTRNQNADGTKLPVGEQLSPFVRDMERKFIRATLESCNGSKEQAAGILGVSLATLYRKMDS